MAIRILNITDIEKETKSELHWFKYPENDQSYSFYKKHILKNYFLYNNIAVNKNADVNYFAS